MRIFLTISLCLFWGFSSVCFAQKQTPAERPDDDVVRVDSTLVTLPVRVLDRQGKFVEALKREDFHVYEDGIEQEIAYFESPTLSNSPASHAVAKPLTVALLLDVSDSTEQKLKEIQTAALAFVDLFRPQDRVIVVAFDARVQVLANATNDRTILREAINRAHSGAGTSLYVAIQTIVRERLDRIGGQKAIVLLSDGVDTASKGVTSQDTIRLAEESYVSIYPVQFNTYGDFADKSSRETYGAGDFGTISHVTRSGEPVSEAYKRATQYLRLLAEKTGGYFQYSDRARNLARSFERIADQLRNQYALGYYPKNKTQAGRERKIEVRLNLPRVRVDARKSYVYKGSK